MTAAGASKLDIRVLGPMDIRVEGRPLQADTRKALAILVLLAVERRAFARDELAALFWPEADDDAARGSLRRTLSALRSGLGDRWILTDRSQVDLDRSATWVDLVEIEAAVASHDAGQLEAAAPLVRGPFLAGFNLRDSPAFDDWRAVRAATVERTECALLDRLAEAQADAGRIQAAVGTAMRRLDLDPLDEPAQRRVIALLAESGDRTGAIRQYRTCAALLDRELGVAPLAETVALYETIRDGTYAPPVRPEGAPNAPVVSRRPADDAPEHLAALPFVGRGAELEALRAQHLAANRHGQVVAIEGEPGIGKTRLLEEAVAELRAGGAEVLVGRGWPAESGIAYAPLVDLLRQAFDRPDAVERLAALTDAVRAELARLVALPPVLQPAATASWTEGLDPVLARGRLIDALAIALDAALAGRVPGVLALDDVHFADASTLEFLGWLVRRLEGRRMLLLLAWRREDLDADASSLAELAESRPDALSLRLRRLDRPAVSELMRRVAVRTGAPPADPAAVDAVVDASEGLPLDLAERLSGSLGDAPPAGRDGQRGASTGAEGGPAPRPVGVARRRGFRTLLRDRLARVGETASQVLAAGAVIGRSFDLATVRVASGRSEEETVAALDELIRRGLIRERTAGSTLRFDFSHASLRDEAYDGLSLVRRRLLHRRVSDALRAGLDRTAEAGNLANLVLIAQHERDAGRAAEAAEAFGVAADRARRIYANREAVELVEAAIALGHPETARLQRDLGEILLGLGDYPAAIAAFEAAAANAGGLDLAELELLLGRAHGRRGDLLTAASHLDAALEAAAGSGDASQRLRERLLVERAVVALRGGDATTAQRAADDALDLARRVGDGTGEGRAHRIRGLIARSHGDLRTAREALERSLLLAAADPDPGAAIAAANALALVEAAAGDHPRAIAHLEAAATEARRIGARHLEAAIENNLADSFHATGDDERSMTHLRRAVALFAEIGGGPSELEPEIWRLESW